MNKSRQSDILLSVKPQYANLLVDGVKSIELRRKFPIDIKSGTKCLIYSSSPIQKVIGECKIESVEALPLSELWKKSALNAMISWKDFSSYFSGLNHGYAINVYASIRYDQPRELTRVVGKDAKAPQSYRYLPNSDGSAIL